MLRIIGTMLHETSLKSGGGGGGKKERKMMRTLPSTLIPRQAADFRMKQTSDTDHTVQSWRLVSVTVVSI